MKHLLFSIVLFFFLSQSAIAQELVPHRPPVRTPEEMAQKQTERLQRDLQLTSLQRDTIYKIHLKYALQRQDGEAHEVVEQRMQQMNEELLSLLTPEQRTKYLQFLSENGPKRQCAPRMRKAEAVVVGPQGKTNE